MPDSARERNSLEEIDALELLHRVLDEDEPDWDIARVRAMMFICLACNAAMRPVAIRPGMKKSPYFRLPPGVQHESGCDIYGYEQLLNQRSDKPVSTESGFPSFYPSKLLLTSLEAVDEEPSHSTTHINPESHPQQDPEAVRTEDSHNQTARTIKRLVTYFIDYLHRYPHPEDRELFLDVPGVEGKTYGQVFQRLSHSPGVRFDAFKIYFEELSHEQVIFEDTRILLPFINHSEGEQRFLEIDVSNWSRFRKGVLRRLIEICTEQFRQEHSQQPQFSIWLFFLGHQDPVNVSRFRMWKEDHRLVHCVVNDSLWREPQIIPAIPVEIPIAEDQYISEEIEVTETISPSEEVFNETAEDLEPSETNQVNEETETFILHTLDSDEEFMPPLPEWWQSPPKTQPVPMWKKLIRKIMKPRRKRRKAHRPNLNGWTSLAGKTFSRIIGFIGSGIKKLLRL
jgi:hypothetical protein